MGIRDRHVYGIVMAFAEIAHILGDGEEGDGTSGLGQDRDGRFWRLK